MFSNDVITAQDSLTSGPLKTLGETVRFSFHWKLAHWVMSKPPRLLVFIFCAVPACIFHSWLAWSSLGLAFGFGETGKDTLGWIFAIMALMLAPLLWCGTPLDLLFSDNVAIMICIYASAIMWWSIIVWIVHRWLKRRQPKPEE